MIWLKQDQSVGDRWDWIVAGGAILLLVGLVVALFQSVGILVVMITPVILAVIYHFIATRK